VPTYESVYVRNTPSVLTPREVASEVVDLGRRGLGHACHMGRWSDIDGLVERIYGELGPIDILVNNAGIARDQLLMRVSDEDVQKTLAVNVHGAIYCSRAAIRPMMRAKTGRVVFLSSVVGEMGNAGQAAYAASKAGLIGLTKAMAKELAPRNIRVNAVSPGFIETDMTTHIPEEARKMMLQITPLARLGKAEEVAAATVFLASNDASYITGEVLKVNGGMYM